ncbi:MAG TPA: MBL fold metallo-hydrolase [Spirochaetota bacterium]|nr:MBL fold metallo-hydrolase [Spirochaetota bacterium]HOL57517.1 MBL fold metallo-hydrolase [Spirochaetota bacterium]HPP05000.1 MBL fold metallo-hydrolase [Spirochaetota bacterium]
MYIKFLGTRGSIPVPGIDTVKYGGNTSCVEFVSEEGIRIIIDAGTGIRKINKYLFKNDDGTIKFFFTHSHWDHLQGLPFLNQLYNPDVTFLFYIDILLFDEIKGAIIKQMSGKSFPVQFENLPSEIKFIPVDKNINISDNLKIELFENHHPGGSSAIKIINNNKIFIFATDNEIKLLKEKNKYEDFLEYCKGSDIIVHDAQYLEKDMKFKKGWGHSTIEDVLQFFIDSNVKIGVFTHHDPERTDNEIDLMEKRAHKILKEKKSSIIVFAAKEDDIIKL